MMADLRLVAGLGNPGPQYFETRHNVGFMVVDCLASKQKIILEGSRSWNCKFGKWGPVLLVKPLCYMNRSGEVIGPLARYYKIQPEEILVVVDDIALPLGRLRLRPSGSNGGHNGLGSIIEHLGEMFMRLRVGVGSPQAGDLVDHVLGEFELPERDLAAKAIERAAEAVEHVSRHGITSAMNIYNRTEPTEI
jgi:PTH1 family peptidyl-tRNA hydrolase